MDGWIDKWVGESHLGLLRLFTSGSKTSSKSFPGGSLVKNQPASVGDMDLIPDLGRSHVPWSN